MNQLLKELNDRLKLYNDSLSNQQRHKPYLDGAMDELKWIIKEIENINNRQPLGNDDLATFKMLEQARKENE